MPHASGHAYDSFVVRLWREPGSGRLLRAEVEHVQTGTVSAERGVPPEWVLDCLRTCLDVRARTDDAAERSPRVPPRPSG